MLWRRYASDDLRHDLFDQFIAHGLIPFGKIFFDIGMWAGNNVYGFYFADVTLLAHRVCCRFYRPTSPRTMTVTSPEPIFS